MARSAVPAVLGGPPAASLVNPFWRLHREIDRAFDDVFHELGDFGVSGGALAEMTPRIDASDTDREITIRAELPGVSADDMEVELVDDLHTIRGEKRAENEKKNESYHLMERSYGSFVRSIRLP